MGTERWLVAIPDGSPILARAAIDPEYAEWLSMPWMFRREREQVPRSTDEADFLADLVAMASGHPGIEARVFELDRDYDKLEFLLSPYRRDESSVDDDWGTRAVRGSRPLPDHIRGNQGHATRHSTADDVRAIAAGLDRTTPDDLRAAYDPAAMEEQCVYKFWADSATDRTLPDLVEIFEGFRAFYRHVADRGEGVLAVVT